jgi:phosphatidylglycerol---prolipoprotein diacylglyceryl transferase
MLAHVVLETAGFGVGGFLYWRKRGTNADAQPDEVTQLGIVAGAALGAAIGSRLLYVFQYLLSLSDQPWQIWLGGKTIVGAFLCGLIGVEIAKLALGWRQSTGNGFVTPLLVATVIGRVGCQLSGLDDLTYGNVTTLPWGWNYGDGLHRHPTALYEIVGLAVIAVMLRRPMFQRESGDRFRAFMVCYLLLRLGLEFLKPPFGPTAAGTLAPNFAGPLTPIQWACIGGLAYYLPTLQRWLRRNAESPALPVL